ncbi:MAG: alpha/beta fold hydrolase, partial [Arthrobacter sp.]|nr:alpha/beta fold hydrolase [Arthrobacter sp.]
MPERIQYGPGKDQWGDLYLPADEAHSVVVVIHGGFWRELRTAEITVPESEDLAARGFAVLNLEYRRVGGAGGAGDGGGWPATGEDILAGIRALQGTSVSGLPIVLLGHSAGGQLAAWAAGHVEVAGHAFGGGTRVRLLREVRLEGVQ